MDPGACFQSNHDDVVSEDKKVLFRVTKRNVDDGIGSNFSRSVKTQESGCTHFDIQRRNKKKVRGRLVHY